MPVESSSCRSGRDTQKGISRDDAGPASGITLPSISTSAGMELFWGMEHPIPVDVGIALCPEHHALVLERGHRRRTDCLAADTVERIPVSGSSRHDHDNSCAAAAVAADPEGRTQLFGPLAHACQAEVT